MGSSFRMCPPDRGSTVVEGLPHRDRLPPRYVGQRVRRLLYADETGTRETTNRYQRVLEDVVPQLSGLGLCLASGRPIGTGRFARVYALHDPDVVLKVSGDRTEAVAWARVLEAVEDDETRWSLLPALGHVHCVYQVKAHRKQDRDLYVIIMDRYARLQGSNGRLVEAVDGLLTERNMYRPGEVRAAAEATARRYKSIPNATAQVDRYLLTLTHLAKIGLFCWDIHRDNVMQDKRGDWKITDLGVTEVDAPVLIPVL